jgi:hypothetical protein
MSLDIFLLEECIGTMARKLRIKYEGAIYRVMNRDHRREEIFLDDRDRRRFAFLISLQSALSVRP